jgi:tetratricopeptide (TPR) repeat protein
MYLKSERDLFRRRSNFPWGRVLALLLLIGAAAYAIYRTLPMLAKEVGVTAFSPVLPSAMPIPTSTPTAGYYAAAAEEAVWEGTVSRAVAAYQQSLDMEPNQTELYLDLARLLIYNGHPERGLEMARQALIRQPENARAWALLGLSYSWLGLPRQATTYCRRAVELDPTLPEAYAYLAEAYIDDGQWYAANTTIATALELDATNVDVLRNRAFVLESQGSYTRAIQGYREALQVDDNWVQLYLGIGRNAGALGDMVQARKAYEDAVAVDPDHAVALNRLGLTHLLMGDYTNAKVYLSAAAAANPNFPDPFANMGSLYFQQRNYEDAIAMYKQAVQIGETRSRRRTVFFVITLESTNSIGNLPQGPEIVYAQFLHPEAFDAPLRGQFKAADRVSSTDTTGLFDEDVPVLGQIRLDVLSGRYSLALEGLPPAPSGRVYVGWFRQLMTPEGNLVRTEPLFPSSAGQVELQGLTGTVRGPAIQVYYTYALSHYLLGECSLARPLIDIALRINPDDPTARQTQQLCR